MTPKSLLLDLLRVLPRPMPVRQLIEVGELFGFEGNAIRVALTRLVRSGLAESDERGSYRLAPGAAPISRLADRWQDGDDRLRPWDGTWLAVHHPRGGARGARNRSQRALSRSGFRETRECLWVRPDNLTASRAELTAEFDELGLIAEASLFRLTDVDGDTAASWTRAWPARDLVRRYKRALRDLERSAGRLARIPAEDAVVESFLVGGRAIKVLATDPLLPDAIVDGAARRALCAAMIDYDQLGKRIWAAYLGAPAMDSVPTHIGASS